MLTCRLTSVVRGKIGFLIEHWQRICLLIERIVRRREAAAVRLTPVMRTSFLPTYLPLPLPPFAASFSSSLSSLSSGLTSASGSACAPVSTTASVDNDADSSVSILSGLTSGARRTTFLDGQADLARLTNTMKSLVESNERCWRGEDCELCAGVKQGLVHVSTHTQRHADALEHRVSPISADLTHRRTDVLASRERCCTPLWSRLRSHKTLH